MLFKIKFEIMNIYLNCLFTDLLHLLLKSVMCIIGKSLLKSPLISAELEYNPSSHENCLKDYKIRKVWQIFQQVTADNKTETEP